jgi:hypothetical protein
MLVNYNYNYNKSRFVSKRGNASWIRIGDLNLIDEYDDAMPQTIAIAERIRHPDYKRPLQYHDIAILRLKEEANYTDYVKPACLSFAWRDVRRNDKAIATGWGQVGRNYKDSSSLKVLKTNYKSCIMPLNEC